MVEPLFQPDAGAAANRRRLLRTVRADAPDPDIIMAGEIRDLATAEMAVQAALTGHLVLSTPRTPIDAPRDYAAD